jgi:hypothetical protein
MSYDSGQEWQEDDGTTHRRVSGPRPDDDAPTRSRSGHTPQEPPATQVGYYPAPQPPKKKHTARNIALSALGVLVVCIIIGAATSNSPATTTAAGSSSPEPSWPSPYSTDGINWATPTDDSYTDVPIVPPPTDAPTTATPPDQVVFHCTGSTDGDGIDIMYGPEGSNFSASHLPFTKTMTLDDTAEYYSVTAQLQGGGHVTCTTTVTQDGDSTVKSAAASGGYNIAMAEVCSSFDGTWDPC